MSALINYVEYAARNPAPKHLMVRLHQAMVKDKANQAKAEVSELDEAIARLAAIPGTSSDRLASLIDRRDHARIRASMAY